MNIELEGFETYHIGIKLTAAVNLEALQSKLKESLGQKGYAIQPEDIVDPRTRLLPPISVLATKQGVRVELNYLATALNTIGQLPEEVSKVFADIPDTLIALGFELSAVVQFYELLANSLVKIDKKPTDVLSLAIKRPLRGFEDLGSLKVTGLRTSIEETGNEQMSFLVEPSPTSPNSRLSLRLQHRSDKKDKIAQFYMSINDRIRNYVTSLGG